MIVVDSLLDREAMPWQADWYRARVKEHLGDGPTTTSASGSPTTRCTATTSPRSTPPTPSATSACSRRCATCAPGRRGVEPPRTRRTRSSTGRSSCRAPRERGRRAARRCADGRRLRPAPPCAPASRSRLRIDARWIVTTEDAPWQEQEPLGFGRLAGMPNVMVDVDVTNPQQTVDGIGGCFNELGWTALGLSPKRIARASCPTSSRRVPGSTSRSAACPSVPTTSPPTGTPTTRSTATSTSSTSASTTTARRSSPSSRRRSGTGATCASGRRRGARPPG